MGTIKSIDTIYNGYKFRSRLEARWAVFFDEMGFEYEYEPEGFKLLDDESRKVMWYLPDFLLRTKGFRTAEDVSEIYVEVKGFMQDYDLKKITEFSRYHPLLLLGNIPKDWKEIAERGETTMYHSFYFINGDMWPALFSMYKGVPMITGPQGKAWSLKGMRAVDKALSKARQARFEHGETPRRD